MSIRGENLDSFLLQKQRASTHIIAQPKNIKCLLEHRVDSSWPTVKRTFSTNNGKTQSSYRRWPFRWSTGSSVDSQCRRMPDPRRKTDLTFALRERVNGELARFRRAREILAERQSYGVPQWITMGKNHRLPSIAQNAEMDQIGLRICNCSLTVSGFKSLEKHERNVFGPWMNDIGKSFAGVFRQSYQRSNGSWAVANS